MIATTLKYFMLVWFLHEETLEPVYFGPFEDEETCWQFDYLQKSGVLYIGRCSLMDTALVPSRPT